MDSNGFSNKKRITLRDIAHQANVSASTVSRVLNNYPYVDDETRQVVRQVARNLGYPLENLRSQASRPRAVTLLSRDTEYGKSDALAQFDQRAAQGAQSILEDLGITTYLRRIRMQPDEVTDIVQQSGSDGLIMLGGITNPGFIARVQAIGVPFVIAGAHVHPLQVNSVMADYRMGIEAAATHLLDRGRKRIALINGPNTTRTSVEKLNALRLVLHLHGITLDPNLVLSGEFEVESGYQQTHNLIDRGVCFDAIVYADDHMALGGLRALKRAGYLVPDDVSVIGFHGYEMTQFTEPPLTSVEFDMALLGRIAARRLMIMLEAGDRDTWLTLVPTYLIVRESS
jgi:LacI family transcriptional regulator